ncbi:hypothetical protein NZK33_13430 [Cyanobium sp. FGCU-6]|nr:hypothetical protein [Cyanobium sp. FGCU6]
MGEIAQPKVDVIITVAEDRKANLSQIASQLQSYGLDISGEPLESLGMICGRAAETNLDQLRNVDGVSAIETAGTVQIAPPESDVQ